jgi:hypothetical protein
VGRAYRRVGVSALGHWGVRRRIAVAKRLCDDFFDIMFLTYEAMVPTDQTSNH